jgi:hypothetical protein
MQIAGEERSTKLLKNFSHRDEQEMTTALKPALEEEVVVEPSTRGVDIS